MRAFVTGGGGFIGRQVVRRLREGGTEVRAITRSETSAAGLREAGCEVVIGDVLDASLLAETMVGCEVAYHLAGDYGIGITAKMRPAMEAANVTATERLLDAATTVGVGRIVHVSTVGVFGDTGHRVVDETYARPRPYRYLSFYDQTKHRAHLVAQARAVAGAPVLIAMPGGVYGPGDHSGLGGVMAQAAAGRLPAVTFGDLGMNMAHVDDIAAGIEQIGERGRIGEAYVLGGELTTLGELARRAAAIGGQRAPRISTPTWALRLAAPLVRRIGPDLREIVSATAGVTYWASDVKARRELGYAPRDLEAGLSATYGRS